MIDLYTYRLPFKTPFQLANTSFSHRVGVLLHYHEGQCNAVTDIAPLPGFSEESTVDALICLKDHLPAIHQLLHSAIELRSLSAQIEELELPASVEFGISTAGVAAIAHRRQLPIHRLLNCPLNRQIKVNATIGLQETEEELIGLITKYYKLGYRTLKLKCGNPPGFLPDVIRAVSHDFPKLVFRVDANRSWPAGRAKEYLARLEELPIEYFEEPFAITGFDRYQKLQELTSIPLALDESVRTREQLDQVLELPHIKILILKPMLFGNILKLIETFHRHHTLINKSKTTDLNTDWVCTTGFESGVGRRIIETLTGMIGDPERAHGLDTGRFFQSDLLPGRFGQAVCRPGSSTNWGVEFSDCNLKNLAHHQSYES
ncbi:MAG: enolase C-terminal domain-like protein [Balneolaceae bacterium]